MAAAPDTVIRLEGLDSVRELLLALGPGLERANERAQNKMAYQLMEAEREQAKSDLDRPTPAFVNSIRYKKYGVSDLLLDTKGAGVYMSDFIQGGSSLASFEHVAGVQILGGEPAGPKRSASTLIRYGWMKPDQVWVPAAGVKLDRYGNIPGPTLAYMLQNMGTNIYAPVREGAKWILIGTPGNYDGIWQKVGNDWKPFIWFIPKPQYEARFEWMERAEREVQASFEQILAWYVDDELSRL